MKENITKIILIMNKLLLPNELIDIIKNYVFYNIIEKVKKRKNEIISIFNSNIFYYRKYDMPEYHCSYPIICIYDKGTDINWHLILKYCEICGKYIIRDRIILNQNLRCNC
jgi:hypothetical protein